MRRALVVAAVLAGCGASPPGKSLVLVTVTGNAVCLDDLSFTLTLADGRKTTTDYQPTPPFSFPPDQTFAIEFDPGVTGVVHINVDAKSGGEILTSAHDDATIDPSTMPKVTLTLSQSGFRKLDPKVTDLAGIDLHGVWAQPGEVIAVGLRRQDPGSDRSVFLRSTDRGCSWTALTQGGMYGLYAVGGDSEHVYVMGENGTILHRAHGGDFTLDTAADHSTLRAVSRAPSGDSFAVSNSNLLFYRTANDGTWYVEDQPTGNAGTGIFAISPSLVYAVVEGPNLARGPGAWVEVPNNPEMAAIRGFWASAADDLWMVGDDGFVYHGASDSAFSPLMNTNGPLSAVWGAKAGDVWIGGNNGHLYHSDGTKVDPVASSATSDNVLSIYGDGTDVYAVGANGSIVRGP